MMSREGHSSNLPGVLWYRTATGSEHGRLVYLMRSTIWRIRVKSFVPIEPPPNAHATLMLEDGDGVFSLRARFGRLGPTSELRLMVGDVPVRARLRRLLRCSARLFGM